MVKIPVDKRTALSFFSGTGIGITAGMLGVGGGELRIPVLAYLMRGDMRNVATSNLIIGFFTVIASFLFRLKTGLAGTKGILFGLYLSTGSLFGAYLGALLSGKISDKKLRLAVALYLVAVGLRFVSEPFTGEIRENLLFPERSVPFYLAGFGFIIGGLSAMFGVAGGEMRIPLLILAFGLNVKLAGTASLLASIPTVGVGFIKHFRMGHFKNDSLAVILSMGAGSIAGAFAGALFAGFVSEEFLRITLGIMLILATIRFVMKIDKEG